MTIEEVARAFFHQLWNDRDLSQADRLFTDATVSHQLRSSPGPDRPHPRGPATMRAELESWFDAFPDVRLEVDHQRLHGDTISTVCRVIGTHRRPWIGIAPTNREITIRMIVLQRVESGKIMEDWVSVDWLGVCEQLAISPGLNELLDRARAGTAPHE